MFSGGAGERPDYSIRGHWRPIVLRDSDYVNMLDRVGTLRWLQTLSKRRTRRRKPEIFISYSRKDMAFADRLEAALKARGFEPLIDRTEIYAFEDWWKRIESADRSRPTPSSSCSRPDAVASEMCAEGGRVRGIAQQAICAHRLPTRGRQRSARGAAAATISFSSMTRRASRPAPMSLPKRCRPTSIGSGSTPNIGEAGTALGSRRAAGAARAAAALAGTGSGRALDRFAPPRCTGSRPRRPRRLSPRVAAVRPVGATS